MESGFESLSPSQSPAVEAESSAARNLGDERGDVALALVGWQVVASAAVRLSEIAADDEGAQSCPGETPGLRGAEPADHLHRSATADTVEDGSCHVVQIAALDQRGVGAPRVGLQVNADP